LVEPTVGKVSEVREFIEVESAGAVRADALWVRWLVGRPGVVLAFVWGLAEGTFFFVVPDVAISLAAMLRPARAWRHVLAATLGGLVGGALMFHWAMLDGEAARAAVARVPFVRAEMTGKVDAGYARHGLGAVYLGPLGGIPYKIYAVEAPKFVGRGAFLASTVPARGYRFLAVWLFFGFAGSTLRRYLKRTDTQLLVWHGAFWVVLYGVYWGRILLR
jgi:membrane protein YqaA with SNARE-associated domain